MTKNFRLKKCEIQKFHENKISYKKKKLLENFKMKLSELIELIKEELDQAKIGDDELSDKRSMGPNPTFQKVEDELDSQRPEYTGGKKSIDKMQDSHAEENELEDNLAPSEEEATEDRKTVVLMTKFGHIPLYKAIIDADNKEKVITALNKLTKEKGFNAATYFLNYYKRLGADKDTGAL